MFTSRITPRRCRLALLIAGLAMGLAASISSAASTSSQWVTTVHRTSIAVPGNYVVVVRIPTTPVSETANVSTAGQSQAGVRIYPWASAQLAFYVHLRHKQMLPVIVQAGPKPVRFSVAAALLPASPAPSTDGTTKAPITASSYYTGGFNQLVWSDDFSGPLGSPANPANWTAETGGGCGNGTLSTNTTNLANASLDGLGDLNITAMSNPTETPQIPTPYTSAQLTTGGAFALTYGRVEARVLTPVGQGLCSAFWMTGDSAQDGGDVAAGEIDVMEELGGYPNVLSATLHGPIPPIPGDGNNQQWEENLSSATPLAGSWHTYGVVWKPGLITWTLDGVPYVSATPASLPAGSTWVFNHPFHIILDLAVGGWPGPPSASTVFPATMKVAWIRVYQSSAQTTTTTTTSSSSSSS